MSEDLEKKREIVFDQWIKDLASHGIPKYGKYIYTTDEVLILFPNTDNSENKHVNRLPVNQTPQSAGFYYINTDDILVDGSSPSLERKYGRKNCSSRLAEDPTIIARHLLKKCPNQDVEQMWSSWYRPSTEDSGGE